MAEIPSNVIQIVEKFIQKLEIQKIHIQQAVVFGSYATGSNDEWSDIDIALVSDAFEGSRFKDRKKIRPITLSVSWDISPIPFRPEDFTPEDPFVREILMTGLRIV